MHWIKLTDQASGGPYYVNLEQVTDMWREGDATKINFLGTSEDPALVTETPEQILIAPTVLLAYRSGA